MSYDPKWVRDDAVVKRDGTNDLTGDWDIGNSRKIILDELQMRDASGLTISDTTANILVSIDNQTGLFSLRTGAGINKFSTDTTLVGDSDNVVPTEKAVKAYVDGVAVPAGNNTEVQYNDNGSFAGSSNLTWTGGSLVVGATKLYLNTSGSIGAANGNLVLVGGSGGYQAGRSYIEIHNGQGVDIIGQSTTYGGTINITGGDGSSTYGGSVNITAGEGVTSSGEVAIAAGDAPSGVTGGKIELTAGGGHGQTTNGSILTLNGGALNGNGGSADLSGGDAAVSDGNGAGVSLTGGYADGSGTGGDAC